MSRSSREIFQTITLAADLIKKSHRTVSLTGAGISTPSGIPDFRSPQVGLWTRFEPLEVASLSAFRYNPEQFYNWFHPLAVQMHAAQPNPAHQALARLQNDGFISLIITQNIDGLHSRAGATNVVEVHGTMDSMTCPSCYQRFPSSLYIDDYITSHTIPTCQKCGSILKPDVILYDEQLPIRAWLKAEDACKHCEVILVVGTSLEVMPSAKLPMDALENGARLIIVNTSQTYLDVRADAVIYADAAEILPEITEMVLNG